MFGLLLLGFSVSEEFAWWGFVVLMLEVVVVNFLGSKMVERKC